MGGYAVMWHGAAGRSTAGSLELELDALRLRGGAGADELGLEVPYIDIESVRQLTSGRVRELRVERRGGDELVISSATGLGELGEILEALLLRSQLARARAAALRDDATGLKAQARHQSVRARRLAQPPGEPDGDPPR